MATRISEINIQETPHREDEDLHHGGEDPKTAGYIVADVGLVLRLGMAEENKRGEQVEDSRPVREVEGIRADLFKGFELFDGCSKD